MQLLIIPLTVLEGLPCWPCRGWCRLLRIGYGVVVNDKSRGDVCRVVEKDEESQ